MNILLVDDDPLSREAVGEFLEEQLGHRLTHCGDGQQALELFRREPFPMVLTDIRMPGLDGIELLRSLKQLPEGRRSDIVLITGHGDMHTAIQALRAGAYDYLLKPIDVQQLAAVVSRIAEHQSLLRENFELTHRFHEQVEAATRQTKTELERLQKAYAGIVGVGKLGVFSEKMQAVVEMAERLHADPSVPVLIEGETGTGKELVARLVHYGRKGATTPFIPLNCSAISANLFESELFGYEGGAFTGARKEGSPGKLELARGGTLFLDEIGDLPLDLQPKLLRVLQEHEFYRVGGLKKIEFQARVVCATNANLKQQVERGTFRRDLFYRLNLGRIYIPALRERPEEIGALARMFLAHYAEQKKRGFRLFQKAALDLLERHPWPGNIRELENTIERVVLLYDDVEVRPEHLRFLGGDDDELPIARQGQLLKPGMLLLPPGGFEMESLEAEIVRKTMTMFGGNKTQTAEYLGLTRSALRSRLKKAF